MDANRRWAWLAVLLSGCGPGPPDRSAVQHVTVAPDRIVFPRNQHAALLDGANKERIHSLINVRKRMRYGEFVWNQTGVLDGKAWIRIDLRRQLISVFRGGDEIGTAVILYGADEKPTPRGRFPILARLKDHRSSLYDAVMPYTLRLTGDGVAIHGSNVRRGAATHGCIGVPAAFAAHLFDSVHVGDVVTIS